MDNTHWADSKEVYDTHDMSVKSCQGDRPVHRILAVGSYRQVQRVQYNESVPLRKPPG